MQDETSPSDEGHPGTAGSPARRREVLRHLGRGAAAAGAASPLAALASGYANTGKRKWCKSGGKNVHASISGCGSQMLSAKSEDECYGRPCSWYKDRVPASCGGAYKFKDKFSCYGKYDSGGKSSGQYGCKFDKTFNDLFTNHATSVEAHWAAAYCNATHDGGGYNFSYSTAQINTFFLNDHTANNPAYRFFRDYMELGGPNTP
jgi:hypothetical protein